MRHGLICLLVGLCSLVGAARADKVMLLTLDGAPLEPAALHPDAKDRAALVDQWAAALKRHKVPAVVFVAGARVKGHEALLGKLVRAGAELGTLGGAGKAIGAGPIEPWTRDLMSGRDALMGALKAMGATQKSVRYFRFPGLSEGSALDLQLAAKSAVAGAGMRLIDATIDTVDGSIDEAWLAARAAKNKRAEAELAQDWLAAMRAFVKRSESIGAKVAGPDVPQILRLRLDAIGAANIDAWLSWLERRGYRFVAAEDVLSHPVFSKPHAYTGRRGVSLFWRLRISEDLKNAEKSVTALLSAAAAAWTRGDLEGYLDAYHADLRFVSGRTIIEGRAALAEAYRRRYPTTAAMGVLTIDIARFDIHTSDRDTLFGLVEPVPPRYAIATVKWTLMPKGAQGRTGFATLALLKGKDGWRILEDHSTTGAIIGKPKRSR
jgi:peptidoglycan/xylan/chitin deacetylase (PgdA/CDA1 family)